MYNIYTMTENKKCTKCLILFPATLEYFYKGKKMLRSYCKKCCSNQSMANPKHAIRSLEYYYKNREERDKYNMKNYIKHKTGVELC
jgi:hypothetical protein